MIPTLNIILTPSLTYYIHILTLYRHSYWEIIWHTCWHLFWHLFLACYFIIIDLYTKPGYSETIQKPLIPRFPPCKTSRTGHKVQALVRLEVSHAKLAKTIQNGRKPGFLWNSGPNQCPVVWELWGFEHARLFIVYGGKKGGRRSRLKHRICGGLINFPCA